MREIWWGFLSASDWPLVSSDQSPLCATSRISIRTAHLRDPDGTLIEINCPLPQEEWAEGLREESRKYEEG
jgi:hypothetical protein